MKTWSVPVLLLLSAPGLLSCSSDVPEDNTPVTGLPWQIELLPEGRTRVFGISPGTTTLREAVAGTGDDMELALIAAPGEQGSVEAYFARYSAGPVTGRLILVLDVPGARLDAMRARATRDGASRRHFLHPDDLAMAWELPVAIITFVPSIDLDEDIAGARFGKPDDVLEIAGQRHWLYAGRGLDLVLDPDGKDVLQYLAPAAFAGYRERLESAAR